MYIAMQCKVGQNYVQVFLHLWVVGRVVGAWVVPTVPTVVPVRYLMCVISIVSQPTCFRSKKTFLTLAGPCPWTRVSGASRLRQP